jgi:hypothetical protein
MSITDDQRTSIDSADAWATAVTQSLNEQRARARQFLRRQQERFVELHEQLAAQLRDMTPACPTDGQQMCADMCADQSALVEQLRAEVKQLQAKLECSETARNEALRNHDGLQTELDELRSERQRLRDQLAEAETDLKRRPEPAAPDQQYEDLRRRFEMAVEDVRELKARNAELEQQRQRGAGAQSGAPTEDVGGGGLDWEAQKQRLMAQLEEFDEDDADEARDRLTIEGAIRITDQVVADKEQQIAQLKAQLKQDAAGDEQHKAVTGLLDGDEVVREERENLRRLQEDWKEKLRKAEIEISVERAKLARERTKMEEQIQAYKTRLAEHSDGQDSTAQAENRTKSSRGNWLSRLGLTGDD